VRDLASALCMIVDSDVRPDVVNVASGTSTSVQECIDLVVRAARVPLEIEADSSRLRHADLPDQVGSSSLLRETTGWAPTISITESCADLLAYWRQTLGLTEEA
jgi:GDP-4-dehydro-6-deoxy-D-mannose reductase